MLKKKAFTLIELLVVIVIIGLLVTVLSISYNVVQKQSRDTRRRGDLKAVQSTLESFRLSYNKYPTQGISATYSDCGAYQTNTIDYASKLTPPVNYVEIIDAGKYYIPEDVGTPVVPKFIQILPVDPRYNEPVSTIATCYLYQANSTGSDYKLYNNVVESYSAPEYVPDADPMNDPIRDTNPVFAIWSDGARDW